MWTPPRGICEPSRNIVQAVTSAWVSPFNQMPCPTDRACHCTYSIRLAPTTIHSVHHVTMVRPIVFSIIPFSCCAVSSNRDEAIPYTTSRSARGLARSTLPCIQQPPVSIIYYCSIFLTSLYLTLSHHFILQSHQLLSTIPSKNR